MTEFIFDLGEELKDQVTGFKGIVMARVQYFTGCNQYHISPRKLTKTGDRIDGDYYDENRLERTGGKTVTLKSKIEEIKGGPSGMEPLTK